jgi:polyhydroxybutyrate depolymerase
MKYLTRYMIAAATSVLALAGFATTANAALKNTTPPTTLVPTPNTVSFTQGVTYQGTTRQVLFIHPSATSSTKAPVLIMLHGSGGTPIDIANNSRVGTLAANMGYWVILPPQANGQWNVNAAVTTDPVDDVGFMKTLIQTVIAQYPVDATRISMTGMSEGGFMTMRVACEQPQLLASVSAVAAEMVVSETKLCAPAKPLPTLYVMGTADPIVPYGGNTGLTGAVNANNFWMGLNACNTSQSSTTQLPNVVNDGTSVTLTHNAACSSRGETDLYTVNGGGHAWPGGTQADTTPGSNGFVSGNLNTTNVIGSFSKLWTSGSTI